MHSAGSVCLCGLHSPFVDNNLIKRFSFCHPFEKESGLDSGWPIIKRQWDEAFNWITSLNVIVNFDVSSHLQDVAYSGCGSAGVSPWTHLFFSRIFYIFHFSQSAFWGHPFIQSVYQSFRQPTSHSFGCPETSQTGSINNKVWVGRNRLHSLLNMERQTNRQAQCNTNGARNWKVAAGYFVVTIFYIAKKRRTTSKLKTDAANQKILTHPIQNHRELMRQTELRSQLSTCELVWEGRCLNRSISFSIVCIKSVFLPNARELWRQHVC